VRTRHLLAKAADKEQAVVGARPEQDHDEEDVGVAGDVMTVAPRMAMTPREIKYARPMVSSGITGETGER